MPPSDSLTLGKTWRPTDRRWPAHLTITRAGTAFLLVIDQFELLTFADEAVRLAVRRCWPAPARDADICCSSSAPCEPIFLDRYDQLPVWRRLQRGLPALFSAQYLRRGLRISSPAPRLAGLDRAHRPPRRRQRRHGRRSALVENALREPWTLRRGRLSHGDDSPGLGGLAGMLAKQADALLTELDADLALAGKGRVGALNCSTPHRINVTAAATRQRIRRDDRAADHGRPRQHHHRRAHPNPPIRHGRRRHSTEAGPAYVR